MFTDPTLWDEISILYFYKTIFYPKTTIIKLIIKSFNFTLKNKKSLQDSYSSLIQKYLRVENNSQKLVFKFSHFNQLTNYQVDMHLLEYKELNQSEHFYSCCSECI